jgi:hypothetical protein
MPRVQIYCYGCSATVSVATARSANDLSRAGWSLVKGETYCSRCGEAHAPSQDASAGGGGEDAASQSVGAISSEAGAPRSADVASTRAAAPNHSQTRFPRRGRQLGQRLIDSGVAASALAKLRSSRFGRTGQDGAEGLAAPLKSTGAALITTLELPFRRQPVPVTSHSKVSAQTIVLFSIATVLILVTLGSNSLIVRLPGVVCSFAAGLSWLRDLRNPV